ncbi:unnamed protein product, partial [marine sediment metagenome]
MRVPSALVQKRICGSMLSPYRAASIALPGASVKAAGLYRDSVSPIGAWVGQHRTLKGAASFPPEADAPLAHRIDAPAFRLGSALTTPAKHEPGIA